MSTILELCFTIAAILLFNSISRINYQHSLSGHSASLTGSTEISLMPPLSFMDEHEFTRLKLKWFSDWNSKCLLSASSSSSSSTTLSSSTSSRSQGRKSTAATTAATTIINSSFTHPRNWSLEDDWIPIIDSLRMATLFIKEKGHETCCNGRITLFLHSPNILYISYRIIEPPNNCNAELFIYQYASELWDTLIAEEGSGLKAHIFNSKCQKVHIAIGHAASVATLMSARMSSPVDHADQQQLIVFDSPQEGLIIHGSHHTTLAWEEMKRITVFPTSINFSFNPNHPNPSTLPVLSLYDHTFYLGTLQQKPPSSSCYVSKDISSLETLFTPLNTDTSLRDDKICKLKILKTFLSEFFALPQNFQSPLIRGVNTFVEEYLKRTFSLIFSCQSSLLDGNQLFEISCSIDSVPIVVFDASLNSPSPSPSSQSFKDKDIISVPELKEQLASFYETIIEQEGKFSLLFRSSKASSTFTFAVGRTILNLRPQRNGLLFKFSRSNGEKFHRLINSSSNLKWNRHCSSIFITPVGPRNYLMDEEILLEFLDSPMNSRLTIMSDNNRIPLSEFLSLILDKKKDKKKGVDCSNSLNQWNLSVCPSYCSKNSADKMFCGELFTFKKDDRRVYFSFSKKTLRDPRINEMMKKMPSSLGNYLIIKDPPISEEISSFRFSSSLNVRDEYSFDYIEEDWI